MSTAHRQLIERETALDVQGRIQAHLNAGVARRRARHTRRFGHRERASVENNRARSTCRIERGLPGEQGAVVEPKLSP